MIYSIPEFFLFSIADWIIVGSMIASAVVSIASSIYNANKTEEANEKNLENANKQFNYQKYLNENQYTLQSSDMQKAGINPALSGSTGSILSSGSYNSNQVGATLDTSGITNIASAFINAKTQENIADKEMQNQANIAEENRKTQEYIANLQATNSKEIAEMDNETKRLLSENNLKLTEKVESIKAENERIKITNENSYRDKLKELNEIESLYKTGLLESQKQQINNEIKLAKEKMDLEKSKHNWSKVDMIWNNVIDSIYKIGISAGALLHGVSSLPQTTSSRSIGFDINR